MPRPSSRLLEARSALASFRSDSEDQPDLFTVIESVADHAGEEWKSQALAVVEGVARSRPELTIEDVAPLVALTVDMRALGAIMLTAKRRGWLEPLGYVNSGAERHRKPIRLWRSLLFAHSDTRAMSTVRSPDYASSSRDALLTSSDEQPPRTEGKR